MACVGFSATGRPNTATSSDLNCRGVGIGVFLRRSRPSTTPPPAVIPTTPCIRDPREYDGGALNPDRRRNRAMKRLALGTLLAIAFAAGARAEDTLRLNLRTRVEPFKGTGAWDEATLVKELPVRETALLLCDV